MALIFNTHRSPFPVESVFRDMGLLDTEMWNDFFNGVEESPEVDMAVSMNTNQPSKKFTVSLDVSQFKPEDLKVNLEGRVLTVEGIQKQKDGNNYMQRSFKRKWTLPKNIDLSAVKSQLSDAGLLSIEAPKKKKKTNIGFAIPIERTQKQ